MFKDVIFNIRLFKKSVGFTTVILLSLSLGIGATTTIFVVIYAVLLSPSLYRDTDRLDVLWESSPVKGGFEPPLLPLPSAIGLTGIIPSRAWNWLHPVPPSR